LPRLVRKYAPPKQKGKKGRGANEKKIGGQGEKKEGRRKMSCLPKVGGEEVCHSSDHRAKGGKGKPEKKEKPSRGKEEKKKWGEGARSLWEQDEVLPVQRREGEERKKSL